MHHFGLRSHHNYENVEMDSSDPSYVNVTGNEIEVLCLNLTLIWIIQGKFNIFINIMVAVEAQRKLSAASVSSKSSRERSNSFREAVQGGPSRKQSYEPIWFAGEEVRVAFRKRFFFYK